MRVALSYEEQIINALSRVEHKRGEDHLARDKKDFDAIRSVLSPLYDEIERRRADVVQLRAAIHRELGVLSTVCANLEEAAK